MATIRVEKSSNFTVLSNHHLDDARLSLKAVGLLSYMLRQPDGWDFTVEWLAGRHKDGRDSIRSCLKELEEAGYVVRTQSHASSGVFSHNDYIVREIPEAPSSPLTENPSTVEPSAGLPLTGNPTTVFPTQVNTNTANTNIPPKAPQEGGGRKRARSSTPVWKPERFERFWDTYPRGEAKQAAARAWDKLRADDDLLAVMGRALLRQMRSESWRSGIGIPYASTWLNQRRWEDESREPTLGSLPDPEGRTDLIWF